MLEHTGFNVPDPLAMARWYVEHLGMRVKRGSDAPPYAQFIVDSAGRAMIEVYANPKGPTHDFRAMHPLTFHLAFAVDDVDADARRLISAGATIVDEPFTTPVGDRLAMLRDPWGVPLQLVRRA